MKIYWYSPYPHEGTSRLAVATSRPDDEIVVQALSAHKGRRLDAKADYEIARDLPDPSPPALARPLRRAYPVVASLQRSRVRRRLLRRGFDVAYLHLLHYPTDWWDLRALGRRTPLVSMVHDVRPHDHLLPGAIEHRLLQAMYHSAGDLVVYHPVLKDELVASFGVDAERIHVVPLPIDAADKRDPGVPRSDIPTFLLFGVLRRNKGLETLAQALELLGDDFPGAVIVAGAAPDDYARELRKRMAHIPSLRLELGHVSNERKRTLFSSCWRVLLPYQDFHSQSAVLTDAYAHRVPAIVSDVGALGATVRDDGTGVVIPSQDAQALASAMLAACTAGPGGVKECTAAAQAHDAASVGPRLRAVFALAADKPASR